MEDSEVRKRFVGCTDILCMVQIEDDNGDIDLVEVSHDLYNELNQSSENE